MHQPILSASRCLMIPSSRYQEIQLLPQKIWVTSNLLILHPWSNPLVRLKKENNQVIVSITREPRHIRSLNLILDPHTNMLRSYGISEVNYDSSWLFIPAANQCTDGLTSAGCQIL